MALWPLTDNAENVRPPDTHKKKCKIDPSIYGMASNIFHGVLRWNLEIRCLCSWKATGRRIRTLTATVWDFKYQLYQFGKTKATIPGAQTLKLRTTNQETYLFPSATQEGNSRASVHPPETWTWELAERQKVYVPKVYSARADRGDVVIDIVI